MTATLEQLHLPERPFRPSVVCTYENGKGVECGRPGTHLAINPLGFRFGRCPRHAETSENAIRTDPRYRDWRVEPIA